MVLSTESVSQKALMSVLPEVLPVCHGSFRFKGRSFSFRLKGEPSVKGDKGLEKLDETFFSGGGPATL